MKRTYENNKIDEDVNFFVGKEVEKTKYLGEHTLFVATMLEPDEIRKIAVDNNCTHLYLGANMKIETAQDLKSYLSIASKLTDFNITIDLPYHIWRTEHINEKIIDDKVIFMVSVKFPNIKDNVFVKIDDEDFEATNKGVWVFNNKLDDGQTFTPWEKYKKDRIVNV